MNCIIIDDDILSCRIIEEFIGKTKDLVHCSTYNSPIEAMNSANKFEDVQLIFLDVEMPEMNGIDFLDSIDIIPQIIMVSSKDNYAVDAFSFSVTDFLLKPITYARFLKSIAKAEKIENARKYQIESRIEDGIFLKVNNSFIRVKFQDILWIEALENYTSIVTINEKFLVHQSLKSVESKIPSSIFRRTHRSYIINIEHINSLEDNSILIKRGKTNQCVPISKSYRDRLINDFNSL